MRVACVELKINTPKSVELNLGPSVTQDELDLLFLLHPAIFLYLLKPYSSLLTARSTLWLSHMGLMKVILTHTVHTHIYIYLYTHIYTHLYHDSLLWL